MNGQSTTNPRPTLSPLIKGAIAGVTARTVSAPLDLLKIRLQMQQFNLKTRAPFIVLARLISSIYHHEGLAGFWKGNMAGIYLYAIYGAVQFNVYERLVPDVKGNSSLGKGLAGSLASMGATLISYPLDLIRTRHTLQHLLISQKHYKGLIGTIRTIAREEGVLGFYKGLIPSLIQVMPYMGLAFASFDYVKRQMKERTLPILSGDFVAGAISGLISKTCTMPIDTIRKRLQIQGSPYQAYAVRDLPTYRGLIDCIQTIWQREGIRGYFKGLGMALTKAVPSTMTTFVVYSVLNRI